MMGIMALRFERLKRVANVKLYVDVDDDERGIRRISPDTTSRSHNLEFKHSFGEAYA